MAYALSSFVMWLAIVEFTVAGFAASVALAKPTPAAKCLSAKLKAAGKKAAAKLACEAKAAQKLKPVDSECLDKAKTGFATAFSKAETQAKGACATTGDAGALKATVDALVQSAIGALPNGGTKDGGKCAASKLKATGKAALAELLCRSKAATKGTGVDPDCISKAEAAFMKAFTKAEQKGGCATTGDVGALDTSVGDFVDQVAAQLSGTTSTTVTTTTTVTTGPGPTTTSPAPTTTSPAPTTTSPAPTTTSPVPTTSLVPTTTTSTTLRGPSTVTVTVGPNGTFVFDPAMVTIKVGDTVHWTWASAGHSVVSGQVINNTTMADGKFCSPNDTNCATAPASLAGATYDHTFTVAGTYPYYCAPHSVIGMVGTVVVQP
jgi:plastocyanin